MGHQTYCRSLKCSWEWGITGERAVGQVLMNREDFMVKLPFFKLHTAKNQDVINASGHKYFLLSVVSQAKRKPPALCALVYCWKQKDMNYWDTWQEQSSVQLVSLYLVCLVFCQNKIILVFQPLCCCSFGEGNTAKCWLENGWIAFES